MFCRNCGAEIPENATHCPQCGTKVPNVSLEANASVQARTTTENNEGTNSNAKYVLIILVLVGIIGILAFEAINSTQHVLEPAPVVSPDTDEDTTIKTSSSQQQQFNTKPTNKVVAETFDTYTSDGYLFTAPSGYYMKEQKGEVYVISNKNLATFTLKTIEGDYMSLQYTIPYIESKFNDYGYRNIKSSCSKQNSINYCSIQFTKDKQEIVRVIASINDTILLQTDCLLNLSTTATLKYYVNIITLMAKNATIETTNFSFNTDRIESDFADAISDSLYQYSKETN